MSLQTYQILPEWLLSGIERVRGDYPDDLLEAVPRRTPAGAQSGQEWRIKCLDCPGKVGVSQRFVGPSVSFQQLYTPGPGETLGNFGIHLNNRVHRQNVVDRIARTTHSVNLPVSGAKLPVLHSRCKVASALFFSNADPGLLLG